MKPCINIKRHPFILTCLCGYVMSCYLEIQRNLSKQGGGGSWVLTVLMTIHCYNMKFMLTVIEHTSTVALLIMLIICIENAKYWWYQTSNLSFWCIILHNTAPANRSSSTKIQISTVSCIDKICLRISQSEFWKLTQWLSMVLRLRQHNIGYTADGFYRSDDRTNSVKALKEGG